LIRAGKRKEISPIFPQKVLPSRLPRSLPESTQQLGAGIDNGFRNRLIVEVTKNVLSPHLWALLSPQRLFSQPCYHVWDK